jgi:hypothetical protein
LKQSQIDFSKTLPLAAHTPFSGIGFTGGGIYNSGVLTLANSTLAQNEANDGGGLTNLEGTATIIGSTFSGN